MLKVYLDEGLDEVFIWLNGSALHTHAGQHMIYSSYDWQPSPTHRRRASAFFFFGMVLYRRRMIIGLIYQVTCRQSQSFLPYDFTPIPSEKYRSLFPNRKLAGVGPIGAKTSLILFLEVGRSGS